MVVTLLYLLEVGFYLSFEIIGLTFLPNNTSVFGNQSKCPKRLIHY